MTIGRVVSRVLVKAAPTRAFELFATHMADWWPKQHTIGKKPFATIVLEPHVGGRWLERDADGAETHWGRVLAWEPPGRLLLGWQINGKFAYDPAFMTEVELTFAVAEGGGTLVTLEHRNLERFGADAERIAEEFGGGWPTTLEIFRAHADAEA